ncbi:probable LRR receptor-like serine/threonine-protein kinase At1g56140 isoform X2 [Cucurbita maxima]|uniref:non-specific serine/threonine protein kinase n=1 Tax=Cucurbita maxima TaxID=3661 RepID=A0A6J1HW24_CUCMA|nr:probable LRR receptor-like serine/threonine-protein kinase At1g56140 isoform X2 [Cucurbita maxima]
MQGHRRQPLALNCQLNQHQPSPVAYRTSMRPKNTCLPSPRRWLTGLPCDPRILVYHCFIFALCAIASIVCHLAVLSEAQNSTQPTTDPDQARALNSIFRQWRISAPSGAWNISGNLCSGRAVDTTTPIDINGNLNPLIKCDCSANNGSTCLITQLHVYAINVVGVLPPELWTLTSLTYLKLDQNFLTGMLSASVGNLTGLRTLSLGINALSGELPKELGSLSKLELLAFGSNNFSGSLPPELGNLSMLKELYIDSSGVSGGIPQSFSRLRNLHTVWASDNEFSGRIPDFIGSWTGLTSLRFQGNSFTGPIPSTFSNLTSLTELRIGDLSNGSSSLAFISNMASLTILVLRNNNMTGSIPSNIGEFRRLTQLDLSFNNLTGEIPSSLFNLSSLSHLFLGNNKLNGTLPTQKSASLLNIDLSYNDLSGSFPPWINQQNLQINLVVNNFTIEGSSSSGLPSGLNCLQRNFPCNRDRPRYSDFGIKCGGPQITSSSGILFERENETLGPATYFVTQSNRWAVSNTGYFTGTNNPEYIGKTLSQFPNSLDTELFQTQRLSASSLRYYGLGLENGNYTVNLHFAEIAFPDSNTWQSRGRRLFDIYIQGNRVFQNFDIRKEAGGSLLAVRKNFTAEVTESFLEIHLFWAGKGTCCIPNQGAFGPSVSAISATPDFEPTVSNVPPNTEENNRTGLIVGLVVGLGSVFFLIIGAVFFVLQRRKRRRAYEDEELLGIDARPYTFSFSELRGATSDFNPSNKLGEGGFGPVYKGTLSDGRVVAVKQLSVASHQGKSQFVAEIATISAVQHRNLVKLYGCCIEADKRLLVYEFLENKSLDQALFGNKHLTIDWPTRFDICVGVARGLTYLHEESRLRIVHRDVKASNILLDGNLIPKISDFGLAKLYDDKKTHISTRVAGTIGYLAPEYAMRGHLTEKADVFGFGVVALEIVSGRPNSDPSLEQDKIYLLEWAWYLHENNCELEMVDPELLEFSKEEVKRVIGVSLLCTQTSPALRPSMSRVVAMLTGDIEVTPVTSKPGYLTDWKFDDITSFIDNPSTEEPDTGRYASTSSSVVGAKHTPANDFEPMLHELLGEGR